MNQIIDRGQTLASRVRRLEIEMNSEIASSYRLEDEINPDVALNRVTLHANPTYRYGANIAKEIWKIALRRIV